MRINLTAIILGIACLHVAADSLAQITLSGKNVSLEQVFESIKKQSGYTFFYNNDEINEAGKISIHIDNASIQDALTILFKNSSFDFEIINYTVAIKKKNQKNTISGTSIETLLNQEHDITGKVTDTAGKPLAGATISLKNANRAVRSARDGSFSFPQVKTGAWLIISYLGYESKEVQVNDPEVPLLVNLLTTEQELDAVTVNAGILRRDKETYTGSTATFSGGELRRVGNLNVIQSLKSLDPSFIVVENNLQGSNPNTLPKIEIRGKTSISTRDLTSQYGQDPNQPLFILNGFESTLEVIYNIDINRIASVTILKDAVSTALYGSKAANGVVVVETVKPKPGKLDINYTADVRAEMPDLSSYNLMNAREKLEFERLAGRYTSSSEGYSYYLEQVYQDKLAEVERGVDTYWLSEPVRTGITNAHSLQVNGGSEEFSFGAGGSYRALQGAMKGSQRNTWGGNVDLTYRRNSININNSLYLSGYTADESPYGSFANFAQANPYYRKRAADGSIPRYLEVSYIGGNGEDVLGKPTFSVTNPLYDVLSSSINQEKNFAVQNNLQAIYDLTPAIRLETGLQLSRELSNFINFTPPEHSRFDQSPIAEKGLYEHNKLERLGYSGFIMATYAKVFQNKHQLNANVRADVSEQNIRALGFSATGYPANTNGNPAFAYGYTPYGKPASTIDVTRRNNILASLNYAYDLRFLLDATYRLDGSTAFGSNHLYAPFWSAGIGWNIHNEGFMKQYSWLDQWTIRANTGYTGNQNFGLFSSTSVYTNLPGRIVFGQGLDLVSLGNPDLEWQNTLQKSIGTDIILFNNRISASLQYYNKTTDPLVVGGGAVFAPSIGITSDYPINVGTLTVKGWEANLRFSPIYNIAERIIWTIGIFGSSYTSTYSNFGKALDALNREQLDSKGLLRYKDGYSPDDIWAVPSGGIDPATGYEIYQKSDGTLSFVYDVEDIVKVGNTRPKVEGVINSVFNYKAFSAGINLRYRIGGYVFNTALFNKIEGIGHQEIKYNLDKRALYERWKKPGDAAQFSKITNMEEAGSSLYARNATSRFVQKDNHLTGESIQIGWEFSDKPWLAKAGIQSLRATFFLNEIFRLEQVLSERGIDYPFGRTLSFSLNVFF